MSELSKEPAQTYQLNVLCSALGRFASPHLDTKSSTQANVLLEQTVEAILEEEKPAVPHTNGVLLEEAIRFDQKLTKQIENIESRETVPVKLITEAFRIVSQHMHLCGSMKSGNTNPSMLVDKDDIAQAYGLPDLWQDGHALVRNEAERWSPFIKHPEVPHDLKDKASKEETDLLMRLMWRHVVEVEEYPEVKTYLTDDSANFHVFWAPLADSLDYATPSTYDRATQLSFDLPHNATHLAHLDAMNAYDGVLRYNDNMQQRAFFEAATVFSEYKTIEVVQNNPAFNSELHAILSPSEMSKDALSKWMIEDRGYEFKLRAARYAADILMIEGVSFGETTNEISKLLHIPVNHAEQETRKYLAWTGLGAVYSFGYRKLINEGFTRVRDVILPEGDQAATTWSDITKS